VEGQDSVEERLGSYLSSSQNEDLGGEGRKSSPPTSAMYTGLDYAHNRYYASTLGRFTTSDPNGIMNLSNPGSLNRYAYMAGDPINRNDPSGLDSIPVDPGDRGAVFGNWYPTTLPSASVTVSQVQCHRTRDLDGPCKHIVKVPEHKKRPNPYPCSLMAGRAQRNVDLTPGITVDLFNAMFVDYYVGTHMTDDTLSPGVFLYDLGTRTRPKAAADPYLGQADFASQFKEPLSDSNDQTHHFAAYLTAGITGHYWSAWGHWIRDNRADTLLGKAGYAMGEYLRKNPGELKNIGEMIRKYICQGITPPYEVPK